MLELSSPERLYKNQLLANAMDLNFLHSTHEDIQGRLLLLGFLCM